jgi:hypothetical protein
MMEDPVEAPIAPEAAKPVVTDDAAGSELARLRAAAEEAAKRADAAEGERQSLAARLAVERAARRLGIVDEDAAYRLLDASALEAGPDGRPRDIDAALRELMKQRPWLAGESPIDSTSVTNPQRDPYRSLTREDIRRMTPDQINEHWDAVRRALAGR